MASTYSTSLRLELMATGDQSGTWGDTTNTNLGTLLEQAITGFLSVAEGDTTLTLTALDGAVDQSRNAVINLTGAMTGAQNVVVPTVEKVYLIKNSTTGGFATTIKTAAGSGVAIPPLTARWVYCDGTNVVDGLPGLVSGYTTTATAAGTTTLTSGSTYYQYFTGATTQTVVLPVTSTLVAGQAFYIVNESSGALTVNSSGGNLVATIAAGGSSQIVCILITGTSAASWDAISIDLSAYLPLAGGTMTGQLINTGSSVGYTPIQLISTQADAAAGPILDLYRNSATPAANDILGQVLFNGEDSAGNTQEYVSVQAVIANATSASEDSSLDIYAQVAGARTLIASFGPGVTGAVIATQAQQETASAANVIVTPSTQQFHPSSLKTWACVTVSGGTPTLAASYNVTSITDDGVGSVLITIATDFSSTAYGFNATVDATGIGALFARVGTRLAGSITIFSYDAGGSPTDPAAYGFAAAGDQ